jgi:hypothetical protein
MAPASAEILFFFKVGTLLIQHCQSSTPSLSMDLIKSFLSRQQNKSRRKIVKLADIRREYSSKAKYDESRLFYHKNKETSSSNLWYQERQLYINDEDPQLGEARAE